VTSADDAVAVTARAHPPRNPNSQPELSGPAKLTATLVSVAQRKLTRTRAVLCGQVDTVDHCGRAQIDP